MIVNTYFDRGKGHRGERTMVDALKCSSRGAHFYVSTSKVMVVDDANHNASFFVDCHLCKSGVLCKADCSLPMMGWRGIMAVALSCDDKPDEGEVLSTFRREWPCRDPLSPDLQ